MDTVANLVLMFPLYPLDSHCPICRYRKAVSRASAKWRMQRCARDSRGRDYVRVGDVWRLLPYIEVRVWPLKNGERQEGFQTPIALFTTGGGESVALQNYRALCEQLKAERQSHRKRDAGMTACVAFSSRSCEAERHERQIPRALAQFRRTIRGAGLHRWTRPHTRPTTPCPERQVAKNTPPRSERMPQKHSATAAAPSGRRRTATVTRRVPIAPGSRRYSRHRPSDKRSAPSNSYPSTSPPRISPPERPRPAAAPALLPRENARTGTQTRGRRSAPSCGTPRARRPSAGRPHRGIIFVIVQRRCLTVVYPQLPVRRHRRPAWCCGSATGRP